MIEILDKKNCSGCTACYNICGHNAITMIQDELGFKYPKVDSELCVNCNLCKKVCPFSDNYRSDADVDLPEAYSFRLKDLNELACSQSGGAFYAMAKFILSRGGVVYGASFTDTWTVSHKRINNLSDLSFLRYSKYVQSDLNDIFKSIKKDLSDDMIVLFSGTPCQIAGLKSFLSIKLHTNLFCIDLICHGVPSPKIWKDYLNYLTNKQHASIKKALFRDKRFGWHGAVESFLFDNGVEEFRKTYNRLYFSGYTIRDSCSNCHFTNLRRVGDVTIGDFWGLPIDSNYNDELGVSLCLVNTVKGHTLLESSTEVANIEKLSSDNWMQSQLQHPSEAHPKRNEFIKDYIDKGFVYIGKVYGDLGIRYKLRIVKSKLGTIIRKIQKK